MSTTTGETRKVARSVTTELLNAGPTVDLPLANRGLGISKAHGYGLARSGNYPVRILKLGGSYRVVTSELLALLGIEAA